MEALRNETDSPMMVCKSALVAAEGNYEKALEYVKYGLPIKSTLLDRIEILESQVLLLLENKQLTTNPKPEEQS